MSDGWHSDWLTRRKGTGDHTTGYLKSRVGKPDTGTFHFRRSLEMPDLINEILVELERVQSLGGFWSVSLP
jgi:hypothetical protein